MKGKVANLGEVNKCVCVCVGGGGGGGGGNLLVGLPLMAGYLIGTQQKHVHQNGKKQQDEVSRTPV